MQCVEIGKWSLLLLPDCSGRETGKEIAFSKLVNGIDRVLHEDVPSAAHIQFTIPKIFPM